jgi:hypothetical protein
MEVFGSERLACRMLGEVLFGFQLPCGADNRNVQVTNAPSMLAERPFKPRPVAKGPGRNDRAVGRLRDQIDLDLRAALPPVQLMSGVFRRSGSIPQPPEPSCRPREISLPDHKIDITVWPGHAPDSEIHGPAAKEPMVDSCAGERVADLTDDVQLCQCALIHNPPFYHLGYLRIASTDLNTVDGPIRTYSTEAATRPNKERCE